MAKAESIETAILPTVMPIATMNGVDQQSAEIGLGPAVRDVLDEVVAGQPAAAAPAAPPAWSASRDEGEIERQADEQRCRRSGSDGRSLSRTGERSTMIRRRSSLCARYSGTAAA